MQEKEGVQKKKNNLNFILPHIDCSHSKPMGLIGRSAHFGIVQNETALKWKLSPCSVSKFLLAGSWIESNLTLKSINVHLIKKKKRKTERENAAFYTEHYCRHFPGRREEKWPCGSAPINNLLNVHLPLMNCKWRDSPTQSVVIQVLYEGDYSNYALNFMDLLGSGVLLCRGAGVWWRLTPTTPTPLLNCEIVV